VSNPHDEGLYIVELHGGIQYMPRLDTAHHIDAGRIPNVNTSEANGVYGMVFHPDYPDSSYVYVHYTYDTTFFNSRLSRFDVEDKVIDSLSEYIILSNNNMVFNHQGGDLIFGLDDYLYFPRGDGH